MPACFEPRNRVDIEGANRPSESAHRHAGLLTPLRLLIQLRDFRGAECKIC
jgi:hypothetical protein